MKQEQTSFLGKSVKDVERIVDRFRRDGHHIEIDFRSENLPTENFIDVAPYKGDPHLKLQLDNYVITSIGLIIQKAK